MRQVDKGLPLLPFLKMAISDAFEAFPWEKYDGERMSQGRLLRFFTQKSANKPRLSEVVVCNALKLKEISEFCFWDS